MLLRYRFAGLVGVAFGFLFCVITSLTYLPARWVVSREWIWLRGLAAGGLKVDWSLVGRSGQVYGCSE